MVYSQQNQFSGRFTNVTNFNVMGGIMKLFNEINQTLQQELMEKNYHLSWTSNRHSNSVDFELFLVKIPETPKHEYKKMSLDGSINELVEIPIYRF
jgi:hypothetical protein